MTVAEVIWDDGYEVEGKAARSIKQIRFADGTILKLNLTDGDHEPFVQAIVEVAVVPNG